MFSSLQKFYSESGETIQIISIKNLQRKFKVINWGQNRPACEDRIEELVDHFKTMNLKLIPGLVCAQQIEQTLEIYDGFHRYSAAKNFPEMKLIIKIVNGHFDVIEDFKNINKAVSVPYLYTIESSVIKIRVCESVVQKMAVKFKPHVSPSRYPQKQNFNKNNFIDLLSTLQIDFETPDIDVIIFQNLLGVNNFAKEYVVQNKIEHPKKCEYNNFFLFYLEHETIRIKLQNML